LKIHRGKRFSIPHEQQQGEILEVRVKSFYGKIIFRDRCNINNRKELVKLFKVLSTSAGVDVVGVAKEMGGKGWWNDDVGV